MNWLKFYNSVSGLGFEFSLYFYHMSLLVKTRSGSKEPYKSVLTSESTQRTYTKVQRNTLYLYIRIKKVGRISFSAKKMYDRTQKGQKYMRRQSL